MTEEQKLKIYAIKTKAGYFLTDTLEENRYGSSGLKSLFFDGNSPKETFHGDWVFVPEKPLMIERGTAPKVVNIRWERKSAESAENLPERITPEDFEKDSDGYPCGHLYKLTETDFYEKKSEELPAGREEIEFELEIILEVARVKQYQNWAYPIIKGSWARIPDAEITQDSARFGLIRQMSVPPILLPEGPCTLSAEETLAIIRAYVKEHIDFDYAEISSDYSFRFTVEKRIRLAEKISYTVEEGRGRRKRDVKKFRDFRTSKILDISTEGKYGEIPKPFEGKDRDDLKQNIDRFLDALIAKINEPITECETCKGAGVVVEKIKVGVGAEEGGSDEG